MAIGYSNQKVNKGYGSNGDEHISGFNNKENKFQLFRYNISIGCT
jgi:hypothetical protein